MLAYNSLMGFGVLMKKKIGTLLVILLAAVLVLPLVIPLPPLQGVLTPAELAGTDSRFVTLQGLSIHYKPFGQGTPNLVLLHGFLANTFTWHKVIQPLAEGARVVAFDRPGFGLSARPLEWEGADPYAPETQADLVISLMDHLGMGKAILVGHSAGGTMAALTALRYPERIEALVLVAPAIYTDGGAPGWAKPLLGSPQMRRLGPLLLRSFFESQVQSNRLIQRAWHDPSLVTPEILAGYLTTFQVQDWDRSLWAFTLSSQDLELENRLDVLTLPVLVITGEDDRVVPTGESIRLTEELPDARLVVIPDCGHVPMEECPQSFLESITGFLIELSE
jgi:pimeloyl-ACP methyl ester carboxylesterase